MSNQDRPSNQPRLVVGVGASAGGLKPLKELFRTMPDDEGLAFVVITHLHPEGHSALPDLLRNDTKLRVERIQDDQEIEPNTIYVLPPGSTVSVASGKLYLEPLDPDEHPTAPVNTFFRSLAADRRERAAAIVLSGAGTDGTIGVEEVKGSLGMTIAQAPEDAEYPSMPQSAIDSGYVDHALAVAEMSKCLADYAGRVEQAPPTDSVTSKDRSHLNRVIAVLRSQVGHDFSAYKTSTLFRRLRRRLAVQQIEGFDEYISFLRSTPREAEELFRELLIGVTSFFRDPAAFEALKEEALPELIGEDGRDELRVWVPGCSTGEEAYSVAIILHEYCTARSISPEISVFATDISEEAIRRARRGIYPDSIGADVAAERLEEYFERVGESYRVRKHIRNMLVFSEQDLTSDPPFTRLDLVSCRNLLIYLNQEIQRRVVPLFHYALRDKGILMLGTSETIGSHQELFSIINSELKIFRKRPDQRPQTTGLDFALRRGDTERRREAGTHQQRQNLEERMRTYLLQHHAPPAVFVTRKNEIIYIHGRTGKYLEPATGEARMNIMDMAREGLAISLGTALRDAFRGDMPVHRQGIRVRTNGDHVILDLEVRPLSDEAVQRDLCVVIFRERAEPASAQSKADDAAEPAEKDEYVRHLEEELQSTRERLQTTVEELETTNEELKSALEESQSTNEELQSSNEELESSKEEMQSLNEELSTVNAELQEKNEELNHANQEMKNFLDSLDIPIVFVDNDLKVRQFTESVKEVINLIDTDVTRPISQITHNLRYDDFTDDLQECVRRARYKEQVVETRDGKRYRMRLSPYRNVDKVMEGVLVAFIDIPESD